MIERQLSLPAPPDRVWEALTDPASLAGWFGADVSWDLRPGGAARFVDGDGCRQGRVDAVAPGRLLRFTWWPDGDGGERSADASEITYQLDPEDGGTRLTVTERQLAPAPACAAGGWTAWDHRMLNLWAGLGVPAAAAAR